MRKLKKSRISRVVSVLCLAVALAVVAAMNCAAMNNGIFGFGRRNADTSDAPPIGEGIESGADGIIGGIESGANDIIDGIESGADDIVDGADSIFDGVESDMNGGIDTNVPDSDIGGAVEDDDRDGISNPTDSDDDNDGVPDAKDTDADNDGIADSNDADPDGDGVEEGRAMSTVVGIVIALLVIGAVAVLIIALMPKKRPPR